MPVHACLPHALAYVRNLEQALRQARSPAYSTIISGSQDPEILIEQGRLMQPPSPCVIKVLLDLAGDRIDRLMVGGTARAVSSMWVEV